MCVYLCLCLCPCLSLSLRLCLCRFLCVDVSVCKYNPIYKYAHSCIRVHTHHDRSTKKGQKKGAMSHYDTWYTLPNSRPQHTATNCNTLQHTATHCNTLQHAATHCNTLQYTTTNCNTLQAMAWEYSTVDSLWWYVEICTRILLHTHTYTHAEVHIQEAP